MNRNESQGFSSLLEKSASKWREALRSVYGTSRYEPLRRQLIESGLLNPDEEVAKAGKNALAIAARRGFKVIHIVPEEDTLAGNLQAAARSYTDLTPGEREIGINLSTPLGQVDAMHEAMETLVPRGKFYDFHMHANPSVILREGQQLPFWPSLIRKIHETLRFPEKRTLADVGLPYGGTVRLSRKEMDRIPTSIDVVLRPGEWEHNDRAMAEYLTSLESTL